MASILCRKCGTTYESAETIDELSGKKTKGPCPQCGSVPIDAIEKQYGNQKYIAYLLLGLLVFWGGYRWLESPSSSPAPAPKPVQQVQNSDPTPNVAAKVIPGIQPVDVYLSLEQNGFETSKELSPCCMWVTTKGANTSVRYSADIYADNGTTVKRVNASVVTTIDKNTAAIARPYFGYLGSLPYTGAQPDQARKWVEANVGKNATKKFGSVTFELSVGTKHGLNLSIYP